VADLLEAAGGLRPELHRYCARLMGSAFEGEDVVQDALERALAAIESLPQVPAFRPWLFRIAHNRALDVLRGRALRSAEPIEAASHIPDEDVMDPLDALMRQEALRTSLARFVELSTPQRSVVILKDVMGESLAEIADLLDLSVDAVKAHLARGRGRLREINARPAADPRAPTAPSAAVANYAALFNARDWDGLRALLAEDVRLRQASRPMRTGRQDVAAFFGFYADYPPVRLVPARMDGHEVMAVFEADAAEASYVMWLEWRDGKISFIHDYRYARYVLASGDLRIEGGAAPRD
jgi:RNA polymerase sigma-70 factor (ECF subfamily)